jgi:hypothetical protein
MIPAPAGILFYAITCVLFNTVAVSSQATLLNVTCHRFHLESWLSKAFRSFGKGASN